ncbi:DNA-binding response regulator [Streptomyces sp. CB02923]|uniref:response regulator n=1 Tax=Streptomyces sp. CB02923 TaxID=1718985 RepID=UPI000939C018|nr:response regulator transcription factor [Streptomyces sp. CB02923]OKI08094.1 DNA-binding response regulator [Streptomyces sp. CB02923]
MIKVLLADDQLMVRAGFRYILEHADGIEVVGEATNGPAAVDMAHRLVPDVVCMDVRMPGGDGIEATRAIVSAGPHPPSVLVVTTFDLDDYVFGALEAGAGGFLLKDAAPDDLVDAVRRLAGGQGLLDQAVTRRVITEFARRRTPASDVPRPPGHALTGRETEVLRLLARGLSNAEIADEMVVETSTVKSHLGRAMNKIGVRDRVQAVIWAYQHGMVP